MINKRMHVLVDLDHTVSNAFWRDPMIGVAKWDEYHGELHRDEPFPDMVEMLRALRLGGFILIGFTARPAKFRKMTLDWCLKHEVDLDELLMRPEEAFRPAPEIKLALARARFGEFIKEHVAFIMDDREDVIEAFRGLGVTALQVFARVQ